MRLWSLHPRYLDAKGLVALWREGLLAQKVLQGRTRGYRHHPQLARFRARRDPVAAIAAYLHAVCDEAEARGYRFDRAKLAPRPRRAAPIALTRGQLAHEWAHLRQKLSQRDTAWLARWTGLERPRAHPAFKLIRGGVAEWERIKP